MKREVTAKILKSFYTISLSNPWYYIIDEKEVHKTVTKKIPFSTWSDPSTSYLKDFKDYYYSNSKDYYDYNGIWLLKDEENRPTYSIKVSYIVYTVVFTEEGEKEIKRRYEIHKRNMKKYKKLLG